MNVPEGFKQTEVGIIPQDWKLITLPEAGEILSGLTYHPDNVKKYGKIVLRSSNIQNNRLSFKDNVYVDMILPERVIVKSGDILICVRNGSRELIGKCAIIDKDTEGNAFGAFMSIFRSSISNYIFFAFQSNIIQKQIKELLGATINQITNRDFTRFKIPLPPTRAEQTAIAAALSDMDALIEGVEKLLEKKRRIKQGAMQELLRPKEGWVCRTIKSFTDATAGGTPNTEVNKYWNGDIRWMNSGELHLKRIYEVEGRITESGLKNSSTRLLPKYCVLIGLAGQGKTRGTVAINQIELCTNQSIAAIFPNDSFVPDYLYYNLDLRYIELRKLSTGDGGRGGLNLTLIRAIEIPFPSTIDEQKQIVQILNDMDAEIYQLETQLAKYRQLKTGMMQELLTGKKRLV